MMSNSFTDRNRNYNFNEYSLYTKSLNELPQQSSLLINTINQYSYCLANQDADFKASLQNSDVLLPDGIGIIAAARLLTGQKVQKIAGADLHQFMLEDLNKKCGSCFYLGSSEATLEKIKSRLAVEYPNIKVGSYSPPFKAVFSPDDNQKMVNAVNAFHPDVVFIGMTAPKQEKWAYEHKNKLSANYICTIGAVFDFYAGTIKRPGPVYISLGLEWFGRLTREPKRLWKRYLYYGPVFIWLMLKKKPGKAYDSKYLEKSVIS